MFKTRDYIKAQAVIRQIISRKVSADIKANTYLLLGLILRGAGEKTEACYYLEKACHFHFKKRIILVNLIDVLPVKGAGEVLGYLTGKMELEEQSLALMLVKAYYSRREYEEALTLLCSLNNSLKESDEGLYWQGKLLLHLREYQQAAALFRKISPAFSRFREVLDLCWLANLSMPGRKESRSIVNQIKLLGDQLAWNIISAFNQLFFNEQDISVEFNNLVARLRFYHRALDYLELLVEFRREDAVEVMIELIEKLQVRSLSGDLGLIFYRHSWWEKAYDYLRESKYQGEVVKELTALADTCYQLNRLEESKEYYQRVSLLDKYQYLIHKKF